MRDFFVIALIAAMIAGLPASIGAQSPQTPAAQALSDTSASPIFLVQNKYFAKAGKSQEVFEWRKHASDVLATLHLHNGRVLRGSGGDEPDGIWEIELDSATLMRESRIAAASPEFQAVMQHMGTLTRRFESATYRRKRLFVDSGSAARSPSPSTACTSTGIAHSSTTTCDLIGKFAQRVARWKIERLSLSTGMNGKQSTASGLTSKCRRFRCRNCW